MAQAGGTAHRSSPVCNLGASLNVTARRSAAAPALAHRGSPSFFIRRCISPYPPLHPSLVLARYLLVFPIYLSILSILHNN
jgi:hypothetical protein